VFAGNGAKLTSKRSINSLIAALSPVKYFEVGMIANNDPFLSGEFYIQSDHGKSLTVLFFVQLATKCGVDDVNVYSVAQTTTGEGVLDLDSSRKAVSDAYGTLHL